MDDFGVHPFKKTSIWGLVLYNGQLWLVVVNDGQEGWLVVIVGDWCLIKTKWRFIVGKIIELIGVRTYFPAHVWLPERSPF